MNTITHIRDVLRKSATIPPERVTAFCKTGEGDYAQGDLFIGVTVPTVRTIAKNFKNLPMDDIRCLIQSPFNEERLLALIILIMQYQKSDEQNKEKLYQFYIDHMQHVNNWNLVDSSAHLIIGAHLWDKNRDSLITLATSNIMWERRIAMVATWYFIRKQDLTWTFTLAQILVADKHDLIHKAVGWMLREAGKRDQKQLTEFLNLHAPSMPRTMLRYAIEKFPEHIRKGYLLIK